MRAVKGRNTSLEWTVRRLIFRMGYRYRMHRADLPGKPDLVFSGRRKVIFAHGCFWHGHSFARGARAPKTNAAYWRTKIESNLKRDARQIEALSAAGWRSLIVWECETNDLRILAKRLRGFLG
jgi:DNA mismatch endonuclease, patch repair protein